MAIVILIVGILLFIGLVIVHEYGHFIAAQRNGVEVEEFAIFFGPTIYKRRTKRGWTFRFNILPLGGYVKLKGEHDSDTAPGSYGAANLWVKTKIMSAGVFSNLITGLVLLAILAVIGMPQIIPNQFKIGSDAKVIHKASTYVSVNEVLKGSPAAKAGLQIGDNITSLGTKTDMMKVDSVATLQTATKHFAGQQVLIDYTRNKVPKVTETTLNPLTDKQKIYLGVGLGNYSNGVTLTRSTWSAPIVAVGLTKQIIVLSYQGLGSAVRGLGGIIAGAATNNHSARENAQTAASSQIVGPVGIFVILKDGSSVGFQFMLFIIALISLTLAIMNILPIPALDGGRLWLTLISRGAARRPLTAGVEELVNAIGMVILILLISLVTYVDIRRFF